MKAGFVAAAAAALAGSAMAGSHHRHAQHHDQLFAKRNADVCTPGCTTIWTTIYGEATLYSPPETVAPTTQPPAATTAPVLVPTPIAQTCPTPGVYTFPATTVTLTETTTVCAATSTKLPSGTHTIGGVTTVVETATTVVCPYATVSTKPGGVVTSVISTTTYVCPSAGTYTIAPHTTTVTVDETIVVFPVVTTYCPGTYTAPAVVTTVTETATVVYCPFTSPSAAPPAPANPAPANPAPPAGNKPAPGGSGDHWAITYTPYYSDSGAGCKSPADVMSDLQDLKTKGFTTVRVYSTDCDTLPNVGAACEALGMKMIIGVFVTGSGCGTDNTDITSQISEITSWAKWDIVELIVVGNECVHNGYCTPAALQALIVWVKSACSGAGYTGTYTTAETVDVWQRSDMQAAVCGVVDIVGGQIHAYFNAQTLAADAGNFVKGQLDILDSDTICPGKTALNLECGWPGECNCNGVACCGPDNQAAAISSIREIIGSRVVFFSTHNDAWKSNDTPCGCEQHWGCSGLF